MKRHLTLHREALAELTSDELGNVAGGAQTVQGNTCPLLACVTGILSNDCVTHTCCTGSASCY
ncbi:MAG TPA: class I lanthipeptide [Frankiaceae bacterium]|jgi:hypothetical protein|nr:class I lanthipeptide [Frankiaceae bacterium]